MEIKSSLLFLLMFLSVMATGQDLMINSKGDSLNVKIGSVDRDRIYYSRRVSGRLERNFAYRDSVIYFERNFYKTSVISKKGTDLEKFRAGITFGGGFQTGDYTLKDYSFAGSKDFEKNLRWGYMLGAEGVYYFNDIIGVGLRYNYFSAVGNASDTSIIVSEWKKNEKDEYRNETDTVSGDLQEKVKINFVGPEVSLRIVSKNRKVRYNTSFAFGVMFYHNNYFLKDPATINAYNMGMDLSFCPEFMISKNIALGLEASFLISTVNKYKQKAGSTSSTVELYRNPVSMSRIDLGLSLKWIH